MEKETNALPHDTQPRLFPRPPAYDPHKDTYTRLLSKRCSTDQKISEALGWAEAGILANALSEWHDEFPDSNAQLMACKSRRLETSIGLPERYGHL